MQHLPGSRVALRSRLVAGRSDNQDHRVPFIVQRDAVQVDQPVVVGMGFHEVAKYWLRYPLGTTGGGGYTFMVNGTIWKDLPDDLKAMVRGGIDAIKYRWVIAIENGEGQAWKTAMDAGVEPIYWTDEEADQYAATMREIATPSAELMADSAVAEFMEIVTRWSKEMGYE